MSFRKERARFLATLSILGHYTHMNTCKGLPATVLLSSHSPIKSRGMSYSVCFYYVEISQARDAIALPPRWGAEYNDIQKTLTAHHCFSTFVCKTEENLLELAIREQAWSPVESHSHLDKSQTNFSFQSFGQGQKSSTRLFYNHLERETSHIQKISCLCWVTQILVLELTWAHTREAKVWSC